VEKVIESLPIFPFDVAAARIYARIWASLVQRGFTVGAHDLIIAATAISLDYTVITSNRRDFEKIEGLRLELRGRVGPIEKWQAASRQALFIQRLGLTKGNISSPATCPLYYPMAPLTELERPSSYLVAK
jgi:hypothetical protein